MSWVAVSVGIAMAVAGTAATVTAQNNALTRQDQAAAQNIRTQTALQDKAAQQTSKLISDTAASTPDQAKKSLLQSFTDELARKNANATGSLAQAGNVSDAYTKAANDASQGVSNYGKTTSQLLSSIDAPAIQRAGEAANLADYASAISQLKSAGQSGDFLTRLKLASITPNPWLAGGGSALRSAGMSMASSGYAGSGGGSSAGTGTGAGYLDGGGSTWGGYNLPN